MQIRQNSHREVADRYSWEVAGLRPLPSRHEVLCHCESPGVAADSEEPLEDHELQQGVQHVENLGDLGIEREEEDQVVDDNERAAGGLSRATATDLAHRVFIDQEAGDGLHVLLALLLVHIRRDRARIADRLHFKAWEV